MNTENVGARLRKKLKLQRKQDREARARRDAESKKWHAARHACHKKQWEQFVQREMPIFVPHIVKKVLDEINSDAEAKEVYEFRYFAWFIPLEIYKEVKRILRKKHGLYAHLPESMANFKARGEDLAAYGECASYVSGFEVYPYDKDRRDMAYDLAGITSVVAVIGLIVCGLWAVVAHAGA